MEIEKKLNELNIVLPPVPKPQANYIPAVYSGHHLYLSGHGPVKNDGTLIFGRVGEDLNLEEGCYAARQVGLALLATLKNELGDLDKIKRVVKLLGFVNSTPDFLDQPKVINGTSDLFVEIFGDKGRHAPSALGTNVLPGNIPVEVEMIVELEE